MTDFGERLYELRSKNNMSQGDLADRLDVSRQTISKWENGACFPETEKLVLLSEILGVSVDYILKGAEEQTQPVYIYVKDAQQNPGNNEAVVRKYVGIVFAVVFSLAAVVILLMGGSFLAVIPGAAALLGILFAANVKHPWLITFWSFYAAVIIIAPFVSAVSPLLIFDPIIYKEGYTAHLLWGYGLWLVFAVLTATTVKTKRGYLFKRK